MRRTSGNTLITVLISAAIMSIVAVSIQTMLSGSMKQQRRMTIKNDIESVRVGIISSMSCDNTFASNGINIAAHCNLASSPRPLVLYDKNNHAMNSTIATTGVLKDAGQITQSYWVRTYCDSSRNTLQVEIAKSDGAGNFARDIANAGQYDFKRLPNPIFGGTGPTVCSANFLPPTTQSCGGNQVVKGVNHSNGAVTCVDQSPGSSPALVRAYGTLSLAAVNCMGWGNTSGTYVGSATCPGGYSVVGGSITGTIPGAAGVHIGNYMSGQSWVEYYCLNFGSTSLPGSFGNMVVATCLKN